MVEKLPLSGVRQPNADGQAFTDILVSGSRRSNVVIVKLSGQLHAEEIPSIMLQKNHHCIAQFGRFLVAKFVKMFASVAKTVIVISYR